MKFVLITILMAFVVGLNGQTYSRGNTVSVEEIAKLYKFDTNTDAVTGEVTLQNDKAQIILIPGMNLISFDQQIHELEQPTHYVRGELMVDKKLLHFLKNIDQKKKSFIKKILRIDDEPVVEKNDFVVVIDAGHGGKDPGALGRSGLNEKKAALIVSLALKNMLEEKGVTAILTRSNDTFVPLPNRPLLASSQQADIFVSIHLNSSKNKSVEGVEVFYYRFNTQSYENKRSKSIASNVSFKKKLLVDDAVVSRSVEETLMRLQLLNNQDKSFSLASIILKNLLDETKMSNRGVKEANFSVLRNSSCPAVLVELGFLSHAQTEKDFNSRNYCEKIAQRLSESLLEYWRKR